MARTKRELRVEFGDFQTPTQLATKVCELLARRFPAPSSIIEPTCGVGAFVNAALATFSGIDSIVGIEINDSYADELRRTLKLNSCESKVRVLTTSFFNVDWLTLRSGLSEPVLVLGNPPWVTNAALGSLSSTNVPDKSNFQGHAGLDAITGKSNFDISEYMIRKLVDQFATSDATIALLCKTAVARKLLTYAWSSDLPVYGAEIHHIDALAAFGASVDACLFILRTGGGHEKTCDVFAQMEDTEPSTTLGFDGRDMIADVGLYERWSHLAGRSAYQWRSGIKHDSARVMEFRASDAGLVNGFDEVVDIESTYLYPLLKSSDLANRRESRRDRYMLVPQRAVGEDTSGIQLAAPKTWQYLQRHVEPLDARASSIYRNRPRFSVFGVGPYTFAPWKVAISGLYKRFIFVCVGPLDEKPRVLDDTSYFVPCEREEEARALSYLLNSEVAIEFFSSRVFWDSKRPITVDLLGKLSFSALAQDLGLLNEFEAASPRGHERAQRNLFAP
jgi:hypothetical protein